MILSLESYSAVIIRRDLRRDCPPYDPVTPPIPPISLAYPQSKLSFSFAIVPTYWAAAYLFIIIIMIVIMIILCLVCVRCANASAPDNAVSGRARNFTFAALLRVLNTLKFSIVVGSICHCAGQQIPPTYDHNDHHDAHSLRRVKGGHNALRIEHVEMVTTETD